MTTLSSEECRAVHDLIDELTGGSPGNAFDWEQPNDPADPLMSALAKVFHEAGKRIPSELVKVATEDVT